MNRECRCFARTLGLFTQNDSNDLLVVVPFEAPFGDPFLVHLFPNRRQPRPSHEIWNLRCSERVLFLHEGHDFSELSALFNVESLDLLIVTIPLFLSG